MDAFGWPTSATGEPPQQFGVVTPRPVAGPLPNHANGAQDVLTPPKSHPTTPEDSGRLVSVSTTFFASADLDVFPSDLILLSADSVFFYVHTYRLLTQSTNGFNSLLPISAATARQDTNPILQLSEPANVTNLVLHAIYELPCVHYVPDFGALADAVRALARYGLHTSALVAPGAPLFDAALALLPDHALDVYALAGGLDLRELAVRASAHLLSFPLSSLTDVTAEVMGASYLKRLFFMHLGRVDALKRLLLVPHKEHTPTLQCGQAERAQLTRAWAMVSAYLAWDSRPDVLPSAIEAAVKPLEDGLSCELCRIVLGERLQTLITHWSMVKATI